MEVYEKKRQLTTAYTVSKYRLTKLMRYGEPNGVHVVAPPLVGCRSVSDSPSYVKYTYAQCVQAMGQVRALGLGGIEDFSRLVFTAYCSPFEYNMNTKQTSVSTHTCSHMSHPYASQLIGPLAHLA